MSTETLRARIARATPPPDPTAAPEFATLRRMRRTLARGGIPATRTPEIQAKLAAFSTLRDLLSLLDEFRKRVQRGERVSLVTTEQSSVAGHMRIEIVIEEV